MEQLALLLVALATALVTLISGESVVDKGDECNVHQSSRTEVATQTEDQP
jgi:hypothetical protein